MFEYNSRVWFRHIIEFRKMDTLRVLWLELLLIGLYAALVVYLKHMFIDSVAERSPANSEQYLKMLRDTTLVHSILGFVLSLLLVFRTNTAYDRWWEGRKLWGQLVNVSRNLAVKYCSLLNPSTPDHVEVREYLKTRIGDFSFALKEHLRGRTKPEELLSLQASRPLKFESTDHLPLVISQELYQETCRLVAKGDLSGEDFIVLDSDLRMLNDIAGGCERILKTPIPFTYALFLKKFIFFFIALLPLGFAALFSYLAIPLTMFVFYVLVSLEIIAEEIEEPFGEDVNDLPTQTISETIRKSVDQVFGSRFGTQ